MERWTALDKLNDIWPGKFSQGRLAVYERALRRYSDAGLEKAIEDVMVECQYAPVVADIASRAGLYDRRHAAKQTKHKKLNPGDQVPGSLWQLEDQPPKAHVQAPVSAAVHSQRTDLERQVSPGREAPDHLGQTSIRHPVPTGRLASGRVGAQPLGPCVRDLDDHTEGLSHVQDHGPDDQEPVVLVIVHDDQRPRGGPLEWAERATETERFVGLPLDAPSMHRLGLIRAGPSLQSRAGARRIVCHGLPVEITLIAQVGLDKMDFGGSGVAHTARAPPGEPERGGCWRGGLSGQGRPRGGEGS